MKVVGKILFVILSLAFSLNNAFAQPIQIDRAELKAKVKGELSSLNDPVAADRMSALLIDQLVDWVEAEAISQWLRSDGIETKSPEQIVAELKAVLTVGRMKDDFWFLKLLISSIPDSLSESVDASKAKLLLALEHLKSGIRPNKNQFFDEVTRKYFIESTIVELAVQYSIDLDTVADTIQPRVKEVVTLIDTWTAQAGIPVSIFAAHETSKDLTLLIAKVESLLLKINNLPEDFVAYVVLGVLSKMKDAAPASYVAILLDEATYTFQRWPLRSDRLVSELGVKDPYQFLKSLRSFTDAEFEDLIIRMRSGPQVEAVDAAVRVMIKEMISERDVGPWIDPAEVGDAESERIAAERAPSKTDPTDPDAAARDAVRAAKEAGDIAGKK